MPSGSYVDRLPSGREFELTVTREWINVESEFPPMEKDPDWRYKDKAGHVHTYRSRRWKWVVTRVCNCQYCWGEDEPYEYGEYRCTVCGELIEPGRRPVKDPVRMFPGLIDVRLAITEDGQLGWPIKSTYLVRADEYKALTWPPGVTDEWLDSIVSSHEPISVEPTFLNGGEVKL